MREKEISELSLKAQKAATMLREAVESLCQIAKAKETDARKQEALDTEISFQKALKRLQRAI